MLRNIVVLPAPFGPTSPRKSPSGTSNVTFVSTARRPYPSVAPSNRISEGIDLSLEHRGESGDVVFHERDVIVDRFSAQTADRWRRDQHLAANLLSDQIRHLPLVERLLENDLRARRLGVANDLVHVRRRGRNARLGLHER